MKGFIVIIDDIFIGLNEREEIVGCVIDVVTMNFGSPISLRFENIIIYLNS